jgi:hypothetical protein
MALVAFFLISEAFAIPSVLRIIIVLQIIFLNIITLEDGLALLGSEIVGGLPFHSAKIYIVKDQFFAVINIFDSPILPIFLLRAVNFKWERCFVLYERHNCL